MTHRIYLAGFLGITAGLLAFNLSAEDTIVLANGQSIAGAILKNTPSELIVRVDGAEMVLKRAQLKSINGKPVDDAAPAKQGQPTKAAPTVASVPTIPSANELAKLLNDYDEFLRTAPDSRTEKAPGSAFTNLTKQGAESWRKALWTAWARRMQELKSKQPPLPPDQDTQDAKRVHSANSARKTEDTVLSGEFKMKYTWEQVGQPPQKGWPLYINLHGGGDNTALNDDQWRIAQKRVTISCGIFLCPRAPVDSIIGWDEPAFYRTLEQLIKEFIALHGVDSDRIYLLGYSMGGWGAFHIGPTFADRWAAVEASAGGGTPQASPPMNLRNTPFMIQIGSLDNDFQRRPLAKAFSEALEKLHADDLDGYTFVYKEHEGKGHQIDDSDAPKWLEQFTRNPIPEKLVWKEPEGNCGYGKVRGNQLTRDQFAWLAVEKANPGEKVVGARHKNEIQLDMSTPQRLTIFLDDRMADLDQPVIVRSGGKEVFNARPARSVSALLHALFLHGDPELLFCSEIHVNQ